MVDNPLLQDPFFSQQPPQQGGVKPVADLSSRLEGPPEIEVPNYEALKQDVKSSAISGGAKGLAGTVKGGLGSIETFAAKDLPELARAGGLWAGEKLDLISPQERQQMGSAPLYSGLSSEQESGYKSPIFNLPTYKKVTEEFPAEMEQAGLPELAYKAKYPLGKIVSSGTEMAAQGIPGAMRTLPARVIMGFMSGAGGEYGALSAGDEESEPYWRVLGSLGGAWGGSKVADLTGAITNAVRSVAAPSGLASKEIAEAVAADLRRGQTKFTPDQLVKMAAEGKPVTIADLDGPQLRALMNKSTNVSPQSQRAASLYNDFLENRRIETGQRVSNSLSDTMGTKIDAPQLQALVEKAGQDTRDKVYSLMRSSPEAQAIDHTQFSELVNRPIMQEAMKRADVNAKNMPQYNIVTPNIGGANPSPGNLSYWDQVKRELDAIYRTGDSTTQDAAATARRNLLGHLDNNVSGYAKTRGIASETFNASSAPEAGYNFYKNMDAFKRKDLQSVLNSYTPDQKEMFAVGFAHKLDEEVRSGKINSLTNKFLIDNNFQDRALSVLGKDRYAEIKSNIISSNLQSKVKELQFIDQSPYAGAGKGSLLGAGVAGMPAATEALFGSQALSIDPALATKIAIGAAVGATGRVIFNAAERRLLDQVLPLATSTNAADIKKLAELSAKNSSVDSVLHKILLGVSRAVTTQTQGERNAPQQNAGGRIGRASGGSVLSANKADQLIKAAESAKKAINSRTEVLLDQPDEKIAGALAIAKRHI